MPANPYADYEKTGFKRLLDLAKLCCKLVGQWEVVIRAVFPDSLAILALLEAVKELCLLIPAADAEYLEATTQAAPPSDVVEDTAGFDPSAPPAVDPDFV